MASSSVAPGALLPEEPSDASGADDAEPPESEIEYSDDEAEAEARQRLKRRRDEASAGDGSSESIHFTKASKWLGKLIRKETVP